MSMRVTDGAGSTAGVGVVFENSKSYEETSLSEGDASLFSMKNTHVCVYIYMH